MRKFAAKVQSPPPHNFIIFYPTLIPKPKTLNPKP